MAFPKRISLPSLSDNGIVNWQRHGNRHLNPCTAVPFRLWTVSRQTIVSEFETHPPSLLTPLCHPFLVSFFCLHCGELFLGTEQYSTTIYMWNEYRPYLRYVHTTRYLLRWYVMKVHPSPQTNKPFLHIPSGCIQTGCVAVLAQY